MKMNNLLKNLNDYCLYLLVFSVTFENWDPFQLVGKLSVTYAVTILYFLSWVPLLRNFKIGTLKKYLIPLLLFIITGILSTAISSEYATTVEGLLKTRFFLLIILSFFIAVHISKSPDIVVKVLNVFVGSVILMFILFMIGQGIGFENGRLVLFGDNPNLLGMKAAVAFVITLSYLTNKKLSLKIKILSAILLLPLLNLIILSASRGALLSIFLAIFLTIFSLRIAISRKILIGLVGIIFSVLLLNFVMDNNKVFNDRISKTIETGETGRDVLWNTAIEIISDNIIIGVGLYGDIPSMYQYSGRAMDPHNTFLWVFLTTGVIGFLFFMSFIVLLGKSIYLNFKYTGKVVFLVIYGIVLFNMFKSGGGIEVVFFWFFFGVLMGYTAIEKEEFVYEETNKIAC